MDDLQWKKKIKIINIDCIQLLTWLKIIRLMTKIQSLGKINILVFLSIKK